MMKVLFNRKSIRFMSVGVLVFAALLAGCESEDTDSDITATRFYMDRDLVSYTSVDNFTWDTTLSQATATIRVKDFRHGDATFRVFDSTGDLLLTRAIFTSSDTLYTGGNDYVVTVGTAKGVPGAWTVELGYDNFTGDITITME